MAGKYQFNGNKEEFYVVNNIRDVEDLYKLHTMFQYIGKNDDSWHRVILIKNCMDEIHPFYYLNEYDKMCNIEDIFGESLELDFYKD